MTDFFSSDPDALAQIGYESHAEQRPGPTGPSDDTPYRVEVRERGKAFVCARFAQLFDARCDAINRWNDARPRNTVHVVDERNGVEHGYARHAGDGSADYVRANPTKTD